MKILLVILLFGFFFITSAQDRAQPDRWRGLEIDKATPEDAIKVLGAPKSDKDKQPLKIFKIEDRITKKQKDKIFRKLIYEKPEGLDEAELYFLDDKLVLIKLAPKDTRPAAVSNIYGLEMTPLTDKFNNLDRAANYPTVYYLLGQSESTLVLAMVSNAGFASVFKKSAGISDAADAMPGKVAYVQLISRTLENADGAPGFK